MIFLSAGHHNADPGAVANGIKESDLTKELRALIAVYLKSKNHGVILDLDSETNSQYQSRIKPGDGSVLCDLHFNASPKASATGTEVIVANNANGIELKLAAELAAGTAKILGITNRGVKTESQSARGKIGILNLKAGIDCLIEVCFISNPSDVEKYQAKKIELARFYGNLLIQYDNLK